MHIGKKINYSFHIVYEAIVVDVTLLLYTIELFVSPTGIKQSSYPVGFLLNVKICFDPILTENFVRSIILVIGVTEVHFSSFSTTTNPVANSLNI